MKNELGTDKITYDTETGQRYTYLGGGMPVDSLKPDSVLAYSPIFNGHCNVLFADGSVAQMTDGKFAELSQRGLGASRHAAGNRRAPAAGGHREQPVYALRQTPHRPGFLTVSGLAGEFHGGSGGSGAGGGHVRWTSPPSPLVPPTAAGIRSLRIELPQTGQPFLFTKVLNVRDEPLSIRANIMTMHTFQIIQMAWQSAAFLLGLVVWCLAMAANESYPSASRAFTHNLCFLPRLPHGRRGPG